MDDSIDGPTGLCHRKAAIVGLTRAQHPMHLHRHTFEVTRIGDRQVSGLFKDVINVMPLDSVAVDFVANNPGDTLLHCHQQLHMDYGFMQLLKHVD